MTDISLNTPRSAGLACVGLALMASGCSSTPGNPIVDMKGVNAYQYEQDLAECSDYADEVSVAGKPAGGAAAGAAVGAAVGAIWDGYRGGSPERGAATGAVVGGASGAGSGLNERSEVVKNCLRGRGYRVLN
jgi:hypothetical protein